MILPSIIFPYRKGRVETVLMFAQAVYLMFSSVYVCKESVEHLLLSASGGEGHHHHRGDEEVGLGCVLTSLPSHLLNLI
jgi:divalent metal cation (Fe/Co/Zn/Cd) transporter